MPTTEPFTYESRLAAYLTGLTSKRVRPFFRLHPEHPIVKQLMLSNEFYAKILACVMTGQEPRLVSFLLFNGDTDALYQNGLYLYAKWREMGIDKAVFNYCQLMNRLLARIPLSNAEAAGEKFPDLCDYEFEIREFIRGIFRKTPNNQPKNAGIKRKSRNLALNA